MPLEPSHSLLGNMGRMVVQNDAQLPFLRIRFVNLIKKFCEFTAAVAVADQASYVTGMQINTREQTQRTFARIFIVAPMFDAPLRQEASRAQHDPKLEYQAFRHTK